MQDVDYQFFVNLTMPTPGRRPADLVFGLLAAGVVAYAQNQPVQVAIEIARRMTPSAFAPTFQQLETALDEAKNGPVPAAA